MRVVAVLLAAGLGRRFGGGKVTAELGGEPLVVHAARALESLPLVARFVVAGAMPLSVPGFTSVVNDRPERGLGRSLALGIAAARQAEAEAVLVALADMPFVSAGHLLRLLAAFDGPDTIVASSGGARPMPPALFGARWFDTLQALTGDAGARRLLRRARLVAAPPGELADVDTPADLARAEARLAGGRASGARLAADPKS